MLCQDIMRRPVETCYEHETVQVAARRMVDANIGFLPVCDRDDHLVGVLTDRDIAVRLVAQDRTASETRVREVMTRAVISCRPSDDLERAEWLMAEHRKSRILIVGADGAARGVISLSDLARLAGAHAAETLRTVATREVLDLRGAKHPPRGAQD
jgi:CBS domain-containing protein